MILRRFDKETDAKMPRLHVVFGAYEGEIDAKPGEKVVFIGDCATWKGSIAGRPVDIERRPASRARPTRTTRSTRTSTRKMALVTWRLLRRGGRTGCGSPAVRSVSPSRS